MNAAPPDSQEMLALLRQLQADSLKVLDQVALLRKHYILGISQHSNSISW